MVDDDLLSDEYDIYIEDLEEVIGSFIFSYVRPETGGAEYFYMGEKRICTVKHRFLHFFQIFAKESILIRQ